MKSLRPMFKGRANSAATRSFLDRHVLHPAQAREFCGIPVSSLAMGTYLGGMDDATDSKVVSAGLQALDAGCNFFDTAVNYRGQRAERSIGEILRRALLTGKAKREEVFVSTKGGFVPFEGAPTRDIPGLFQQYYVARGLAETQDLIGGCHCMAPSYIHEQIEKSLRNLQLETIDLYYLHNPEMQLEELPERVFYAKLEKAFGALERAVSEGKIAAYGIATWNGLRDEPTAQTAMSLERCMEAALHAANQAGNAKHSFRAVQMPLSLAMPEGALLKTQKIVHHEFAAIDAAETLGLDVAVSVPLLQSRLCHDLPDFILSSFPKEFSQAHSALSFAGSFAPVKSVMVGMKQFDHVAHNLEMLKKDRLSTDQLKAIVGAMMRSTSD